MTTTNDRNQVPAATVTTWEIDPEASRVEFTARMRLMFVKTLLDAGIFDAIQDASRYDALRPRIFKMDRQTQAREIRKLISGPDFMLGSINAITEDGVLVVASASASQLGLYASTAGKVILVVGSQKIVPDLETALRRIRDYVLPWEDSQVRKVMNIGSFVGKILLIEREWINGRMTVILVRKPIGI